MAGASLRLPSSAPVGSFHPTRFCPCRAHWGGSLVRAGPPGPAALSQNQSPGAHERPARGPDKQPVLVLLPSENGPRGAPVDAPRFPFHRVGGGGRGSREPQAAGVSPGCATLRRPQHRAGRVPPDRPCLFQQAAGVLWPRHRPQQRIPAFHLRPHRVAAGLPHGSENRRVAPAHRSRGPGWRHGDADAG